MITKSEFELLFTTFGSMGMPKSEWFRLFSAKRLNDPPACSKNAQKRMEKKMKTSGSEQPLVLLALNLRISQPRYTKVDRRQ